LRHLQPERHVYYLDEQIFRHNNRKNMKFGAAVCSVYGRLLLIKACLAVSLAGFLTSAGASGPATHSGCFRSRTRALPSWSCVPGSAMATKGQHEFSALTSNVPIFHQLERGVGLLLRGSALLPRVVLNVCAHEVLLAKETGRVASLLREGCKRLQWLLPSSHDPRC
jgi:hypothetical protein